MIDGEVSPVVPGAALHTTSRREWLGLFGAVAWMFFMMYGWNLFINNDLTGSTNGTIHQTVFMLVLALSIVICGFRCGRDPNRIANVAFYTTPAALVITAVFALCPGPAASILYICAPVLFAPALVRRVYGVVRTSGKRGLKNTRYVSCVVFCLIAFILWIYVLPPKEIAYLIPALLALPAWAGIRRVISLPEKEMPAGVFKLTRRIILPFITIVVILFILNLMNSVFRDFIVEQGYGTSTDLLLVSGLVLPPVGFIIYAFIADKGFERLGILCSTGLLLISVILALLPDRTIIGIVFPLAVVNILGGAYSQYFFLTIPLDFYKNAKRPALVTSLGVVFLLVTSVIEWQNGYLPERFRSIDAPILAFIGVFAVLFLIMVYFVFERRREKTFAAALYALLNNDYGEMSGETADAETSREKAILETIAASEELAMIKAGLTPEEIKVALLLLDGSAQRDVGRKLHIRAADVSRHEKAIRQKLHLMSEPDPVIAAVIAEFKLTKRETEMLRYLRRGAENDEISSDLYLSEETVKTHIRNLMKKLPVLNRQDVPGWLETYGIQAE